MFELFDAIYSLKDSLGHLLLALGRVLVPWLPLAGWIAFWLYAVNWQKLRLTLAKGGWIGIALIAAITVLIWGIVAPHAQPADVFGLKVSNFVEKTVYVTALICIMFFCGSLQLSGFCGECCRFEEEEPEEEDAHGHHGHGNAHAPAGDHGHAGH